MEQEDSEEMKSRLLWKMMKSIRMEVVEIKVAELLGKIGMLLMSNNRLRAIQLQKSLTIKQVTTVEAMIVALDKL